MFDIGFSELLIIAVVALVVLGPDKLPTAIKTVGLWVGRIRRTVSSIQSEISEELRIEEMKRTTAISKEQLEKELKEMSQPFIETLDVESPMAAKASSPEQLKEAADARQEQNAPEQAGQNPQEKS
jgi:sec-independent protein translocase protein TatB